MKDCDDKRRQFLQLMMSLPVGFVIGCDLRRDRSTAKAPLLSPEEALRKLILLVGPWSTTEKEKAEDFARRFLKAKHTVVPYLPKSSKLVQNLASRFSAETMSLKEINLGNLPAEERELLMKLIRQLYSFIEVRFYV
ncbi:MAG: hypothetical protein GY774_30165, partial [Planctomycetes bacterium]|nr:hypothetical protein [Planctomycetota bacterium]